MEQRLSRDTTAVPAAISELAEKLTREIDDHDEGEGAPRSYQYEYNEVYGQLVNQSRRVSAIKLQSQANTIGNTFGDDDEEMPMFSSLTPGVSPSSSSSKDDKNIDLGHANNSIRPPSPPDSSADERKHPSEKTAAPRKAPDEKHRSIKGSNSGKLGVPKKSHATLGYSRIVKDRSKWQPFEYHDTTAKKSSFSLIKERIESVWRGESSEERELRLRLNWYRRALLSEISILKSSMQIFKQRRVDGAAKLDQEIRTLESQGLQSLIKYLQLQFWSHLDRYSVVETLTSISMMAMQSRYTRSARVIELYKEEMESIREKRQQKHDLDTFRHFCLNPDEVVAKEQSFVTLSKRLARMDRVVNYTRDVFMRYALPKISAPSHERLPTVHSLLQTYDKLKAETEPPHFNDSKFTWKDLCMWYSELHRQKLRTELAFMEILMDERERNGRLFKQWTQFVLNEKRGGIKRAGNVPDGEVPGTQIAAPTGNSSLDKTEDGGDNLPQTSEQQPNELSSKNNLSTSAVTEKPVSVISPRSVLAFIKYYSTIVLAADYEVKAESTNTLKALTEVAVYRRVHSKTYRYTSVSLQARDLHWIYKCRLAKFVDPITFGIDEVYLRGPSKNKGLTKTSNTDETCDNIRNGGELDLEEKLRMIDAKYEGAALLRRDVPSPGVPKMDTDSETGLQFNHYGRPYANVSKLLSLMNSTVNPRHIADILLLAVKWLMKEAVTISGKAELLGADTVFPILVLSLVYADIPNIHLMLQYLHNYAEISEASETSYYLTCLEAAVEYIIRLEVPPKTVKLVHAEIEAGRIPPHGGLEDLNDVVALEALTDGQQDYKIDEKSDLEDLGEWLREYQTMEDTISILTKEGIF